MTRIIPDGAFLYKEGLYIVETPLVLGGIAITRWELYSAEGWCFYDLQDAENYVDGEVGGELLPENQRLYAQYLVMRKDEDYVTNNIIPVPVQEGFEIVSVSNDHITK